MFKALTKLSYTSKQFTPKPFYAYYSQKYVQPWDINKKTYVELVDALGSAVKNIDFNIIFVL